MTTANGRTIGLAHHASRAVAERVLRRHGLRFLDHLALRAALAADGPFEPDDLAAQLTDDLKNN